MAISRTPRWAVFLSTAGPDVLEALPFVPAINERGATVFLDEQGVRLGLHGERRVLAALNAADEVLVLLTPTPGSFLLSSTPASASLDRRFIWLAVAAAWVRNIPLVGALHRIMQADLDADPGMPHLIKTGELFDSSDLERYLKALERRMKAGRRRQFIPIVPIAEQALVKSSFYDVCLCHNSCDKAKVRQIEQQLRDRGLLPLMDEWHLDHIGDWHSTRGKKKVQFHSGAVFLDQGDYITCNNPKLDKFLKQLLKLERRVIFVNLHDSGQDLEIPAHLEGRVRQVDYRPQTSDPINHLVWEVLGFRYDPVDDFGREQIQNFQPKPAPQNMSPEEREQVARILAEQPSYAEDIRCRRVLLESAGVLECVSVNLEGNKNVVFQDVVNGLCKHPSLSKKPSTCPIGMLLEHVARETSLPVDAKKFFQHLISKYHLMPHAPSLED